MKKLLIIFWFLLLVSFSQTGVFAQMPSSIVINEIAYRGTVASGTDEWMELFNPGSQTVDLAGWKLMIGAGETVLKGSIPAQAYFLLERTNDQTVSDIPADQIFTGSLTDSGVMLKLVNPAGQIADQVSKWYVNLDKPPASFSIRSSMERVDAAVAGDVAENWAINNQKIRNGLDANGNAVVGTPRARNSVAIVAAPTPPPSDSSAPLPPSPPQVGRNDNVVIWRFLANPNGRDDDVEWIELKNHGNDSVDLNGYKLANREGGIKPVSLQGTILAGKTLRFFSRDTKIILRNTTDKIRLFDPKGQMMDELEWKKEIREGIVMLRQDLFFTPDTAKVISTVDGDTITVEIQDEQVAGISRKETVRLIGVDSPESVHPSKPMEFFGKESAEYTRQQLSGKSLRLEYGDEKRDDYGRLLAFVFLGDRHFNAELIEKGFARAYLRYPFAYAAVFKKLEEEARTKRLGLWAGGSTSAPTPGPLPLGDLSKPFDNAQGGADPAPKFDPLLKRILNRLNAMFRRLFGKSPYQKEALKNTFSRVNGDKLARHFALFLALELSEMPTQRIA